MEQGGVEGEAVGRGEERGPGWGGQHPAVCGPCSGPAKGGWKTRLWAPSPQEGAGRGEGLAF